VYEPTRAPEPVTDTNLSPYIGAPVTGAAGIGYFNAPQYHGTVAWAKTGESGPHSGLFGGAAEYTATVQLSPVAGYSLKGLGAGAFTHEGAGAVSFTAESGVVTIDFRATDPVYIEDYNLQGYVPVPAAGERPVRELSRAELEAAVSWTDAAGAGLSGAFQLGTAYRAEIRLAAKGGYAFRGDRAFGYPAGAGSVSGDDGDARVRTLTVVYKATEDPEPVGDKDLGPYIPAPAAGAVGISYFTASQYSGTVAWTKTGGNTPHKGPFEANTKYTAAVRLTPAMGYTLTGLEAGGFTHDGADTTDAAPIAYNAEEGQVTVKFAVTAKRPISGILNLNPYLPAPAAGETPVTALAVPAGSPFTGTVAWTKTGETTPHTVAFAAGTAYTAAVSLTPNPGYDLPRISPLSIRGGPWGASPAPAAGGLRYLSPLSPKT
jgi:hypothetical protein